MFGSEKIEMLRKENQELRTEIAKLKEALELKKSAVFGLAAIAKDAAGYITSDEERREFQDRIETFRKL